MKNDLVLGATFLIGLVISGCASSEQPKAVAKETESPPRFSKDVKPVENLDRSDLFLSHLNLTSRFQVLNLSNKLYLADDVDRATEVFGPPPKAYDVTDLPPGWKDEGYKAAGWETSVRSGRTEASLEGFGVILQKDRVALAMLTVAHADANMFGRIITEYQEELRLKPVSAADKKSRYRFWTIDDQSLMVSATTTSTGDLITVALGAKPLMDGLRMNVDRAKEDIKDSDRILASRSEPAANK